MKEKIAVRDLSMAFALLAIIAFFAMHPKSAQFLSPQNLSNLSIELSITALLALGMLLVLLPGKIDLSVGSGVGLLGGCACALMFWGKLAAPLAMLATVAVALVVWALMGTLIVRQRVPAFIITLGGLLVFKGLHWMVIRNSTVPVAPGGVDTMLSLMTTSYVPPAAGYVLAAAAALWFAVSRIADRRNKQRYGFPVDDKEMLFLKIIVPGQALFISVLVLNLYKGIPLPLMILGLMALLVTFITNHTRFGRHLYAIGGNEEAAVLSGIPVEKVITFAYVFLGAIVALTGFMQTAYGGYSTSTVGNLMELDAIAACVIGGTSLKGGRGTVMGVLFGAMIMAVLLNGMTLLAVSPEAKLVARGTVLVLAVWMDVALSKKAR